MTVGLTHIIAATTRWLTRAYPGSGTVRAMRVLAQARQAVTVAAWLRYPTVLDGELVALVGSGGSARLDRICNASFACTDAAPSSTTPSSHAPASGAGPDPTTIGDGSGRSPAAGEAWRTWVDEVVASWAACLLADTALAAEAVRAVADCEHTGGLARNFRRLTQPDQADLEAAALLRHPDLLAPIADLHRDQLIERLAGTAQARPAAATD